MPVVPSILTTLDLPLAELCAARIDGDLVAFGGGYRSLASIETPALRIHSVLGAASPRLIAELGTAAWVWGAVDLPPVTLEFCSAHAARFRPTFERGALIREVRLDPEDVISLDGRAVTTPLRTTVDLARSRPEFGPLEQLAVRELARIADLTLPAARALMDRRPNLSGKRRALTRLEGVLSPS